MNRRYRIYKWIPWRSFSISHSNEGGVFHRGNNQCDTSIATVKRLLQNGTMLNRLRIMKWFYNRFIRIISDFPLFVMATLYTIVYTFFPACPNRMKISWKAKYHYFYEQTYVSEKIRLWYKSKPQTTISLLIRRNEN